LVFVTISKGLYKNTRLFTVVFRIFLKAESLELALTVVFHFGTLSLVVSHRAACWVHCYFW